MGEIDGFRVSDGDDAAALRQEVRERSFRVLGQALKTYILCEDSEGLIFIDQHAAHERLVFERFKKGYETKSLSVNRLLTPVLMECSSEEVLAISDHLEDLNAMGIEVDPVGKKVFAIRSIPSLIGDEDPRGIIRKIIEEEVSAATRDKTKGALHPILVALSCHSAIRANFEMRKEEMEALVDDLLAQPLSATCPHGRPIFFRLLRDDRGNGRN